MTKKIFWWGLGLVALVGIISIIIYKSPIQRQPVAQVPTLQTIKIGYRDHSGYWPSFVAQEQKFFEKNGLKAELINFKSTNQLMESLIKGDIDASLGAVNTILLATIEAKSPDEFKVFTISNETLAKPFSALVVKNDSKINSLNELVGKKISAHPGSTPMYLFQKAVENKIGKGKAQLVQMEGNLQLQALEAGQTEAAIIFEPTIAIGKNKNLIKILDTSLWSQFMPNKAFPLQASVVSAKLIKNNPELVKKLIKATNEAIDFAKANRNEAQLAIAKYTTLDPAVSELVPIPDTYKLTEINIAQLQSVFDLLLQDGQIKTAVQAKNMLLPTYATN